jgi:hypothetical protein
MEEDLRYSCLVCATPEARRFMRVRQGSLFFSGIIQCACCDSRFEELNGPLTLLAEPFSGTCPVCDQQAEFRKYPTWKGAVEAWLQAFKTKGVYLLEENLKASGLVQLQSHQCLRCEHRLLRCPWCRHVSPVKESRLCYCEGCKKPLSVMN